MKAALRMVAILSAVTLCFAGVTVPALAEQTGEAAAQTETDVQGTYTFTSDNGSYFSYYRQYEEKPAGGSVTVDANAVTITASENVMQVQDGKTGVLIGDDNAWAELSVTVPSDGRYSLCIGYYPLKGSTRSMEFGVAVDGETPYSEWKALSLPRYFQEVPGSREAADGYGNDRMPESEEVFRWREQWMWDSQGFYDEPYFLYLTAGTHVLRLSAVSSSFLLGQLTLGQPPQAVTYETYRRQLADNVGMAQVNTVRQAEDYAEKNSAQISSSSDRGNAGTTPSDPIKKKINVIGGSNWKYAGQALTWDMPIEADGWYELSFRYRQDVNQGMTSYRRLLIDGALPFAEAANVEFPYTAEWRVTTFGGDEPYRIWLTAGTHALTLEVAPGKLCGVLRNTKKAVLDLTQLYRSIVMVTGSSPDVYRDYALEKQIPGLRDGLNDVQRRLTAIGEDIESITGSSGSLASGIVETAVFLREIDTALYQLPERVSRMNSLLTSLGSLLLQLSEQPLELDSLAAITEGGEPLQANAGFFQQLQFTLTRFCNSYVADYSSIGGIGGKDRAIEVWVSSGRDQAQVLEGLITDQFLPQSSVGVNLSLVNTGNVLIQATLAGKGPDVALMVAYDLPVNLAMRGALTDLRQFGLDPAKSAIQKNAWIPYQYNGGIYAMPETQVFDMLFYRTDIFDSLGLQPPSTWEDFYEVLTVLQQNNLQVGIPETSSATPGISVGITTFDKFLYQAGGRYYNDTLSATEFDTNTAVEAFIRWTQLYTKYGLDREVSFYNRFRTGEVAMGIQSYSMYNQLTAAAPELKGMWSMAPIPGTLREDGTVDRTQTSTGSAAILLNSAVKKGLGQEAYDFIYWWTGSEAQANYGNKLESIMGVAARYTPANTEALAQLGWTDGEQRLLADQWQYVTAVEQIPGSYVVSRSLTSAFRTAVDEDLDARRQLLLYNNDMNGEIQRKRREFKLDEATGGIQ